MPAIKPKVRHKGEIVSGECWQFCSIPHENRSKHGTDARSDPDSAHQTLLCDTLYIPYSPGSDPD
jgi:hypothetical protein